MLAALNLAPAAEFEVHHASHACSVSTEIGQRRPEGAQWDGHRGRGPFQAPAASCVVVRHLWPQRGTRGALAGGWSGGPACVAATGTVREFSECVV